MAISLLFLQFLFQDGIILHFCIPGGFCGLFLLKCVAAGNRVRNIVTNAHPGGVFVLFPASDGTLISGGKDKRLVVWDQDLNRTGMNYEVSSNLPN